MIRELSAEDVLRKFKESAHPSRQGYLAMYSSWYGGIVKDPQLMMLPIDDHMVHRGDGVFEAIKCVDGKIYALDRHLERLGRSAEKIGLKPLGSANWRQEIHDICVETVRASKTGDCLLRLYVSRGPGGFTTNPYEAIASQLYLVITQLKGMGREKYEKGVTAKISAIAVKEGFFANVKSCNYLPNVLMKKEAVDAGVDFTVSKDEKGYLAEGSTENFAIVNKAGEMIVPGFERTLRGVTAVRAMELAEKLVKGGQLKGVRNAHIKAEDVFEAREAMMLGTTLDCLPVTSFEGKPVGPGGRVGDTCKALLELILTDMKTGPFVTVV